ncbi:MAG: ABC transporter substrate-binding protein, partial [Sphingomicrobium sp.]
QPPQPGWLSVPIAERRPALVAEAKRIFGDTERPTLRLAMPTGPGGDLLFRRISADWETLGVTTVRAPTAASADLVWIDEVAPSASPAWLLRRFRCEVAPICVEAAESLLEAARSAPVAAQRAALFLEAARLMDEAELFIAITAPIRWSLVSGRAPGFAENPFARHTLVGLSDTKISGDSP